jgi:hypothetical protein
VSRRRLSGGRLAGWAGVLAVLWFLGGRGGLAVGAAIVVWDLLLAPAPKVLLLGSLLAFVAVPVAVLARGLPTRATLSPDFAAGSLLPHLLAGAGLALLVLGTLRSVRASLPPDGARELGPREPADPRAIAAPETAPPGRPGTPGKAGAADAPEDAEAAEAAGRAGSGTEASAE